jgi:AraC family transcriptional regulator
MTPEIKTIGDRKMVGHMLKMSHASNRTAELWKSFMPRRSEITNRVSSDLISLQVFGPEFFSSFDPDREFEKWALAEVSDFDPMPDHMAPFVLKGGQYAVFQYRGPAGDPRVFQYIYGEWLPSSGFILDDRPHFEVLGAKYRNNDPHSEEEIWIPIVSVRKS